MQWAALHYVIVVFPDHTLANTQFPMKIEVQELMYPLLLFGPLAGQISSKYRIFGTQHSPKKG